MTTCVLTPSRGTGRRTRWLWQHSRGQAAHRGGPPCRCRCRPRASRADRQVPRRGGHPAVGAVRSLPAMPLTPSTPIPQALVGQGRVRQYPCGRQRPSQRQWHARHERPFPRGARGVRQGARQGRQAIVCDWTRWVCRIVTSRVLSALTQTLTGGAGNMTHGHTNPTPWDEHKDSADAGRGRDGGKHHGGGVIQNVLRSLSRARGGDRDKSR